MQLQQTLAGKYQILEHIGTGGMSVVYKAKHLQTEQTICIKVLLQSFIEAPEAVRRLRLEAKTLAGLNHPNILRIIALDKDEEQLFIVTEFIEGKTLTEILDAGSKLDSAGIKSLFEQIAEALQYAHLQGVVHRDLKPSNLLITDSNGKQTAKVLDFGIAKVLDHDTFQRMTRTGVLIGTPNYMSPEQCSGEKIDVRTDIYSFGCVLYEVLSGQKPFDGETPLDTMYKHLNCTPPPLVHGSLSAVAMRCLEKDPADRFQNMEEVLDAIRTKEHQHYTAKARRPRKRGPLTLLASIVVLCTLFGTVVGWFYMQLPHVPTKEQFDNRTTKELMEFFQLKLSDKSKFDWPGIDYDLAVLKSRDLGVRERAEWNLFSGMRLQLQNKPSEASDRFADSQLLYHAVDLPAPWAASLLALNISEAEKNDKLAVEVLEKELLYADMNRGTTEEKVLMLTNLTVIHQKSHNYKELLKVMERIKATTEPGSLNELNTIIHLAWLHEVSGHRKEAFSILTNWGNQYAAVADEHIRAEYHLAVGEHLLRAKNLDAAKRELDASLALHQNVSVRPELQDLIHSQISRAHFDLACVLSFKGKPEEALNTMDKAVAQAAYLSDAKLLANERIFQTYLQAQRDKQASKSASVHP